MMSYNEFVKQNKTKLESFCKKYFNDNFQSDISKLTNDRFLKLLENIEKINQYSTDEKEVNLRHKLTYLFNFLSDALDTSSEPYDLSNDIQIDNHMDILQSDFKRTIDDLKECVKNYNDFKSKERTT